jgi:hypothetical protein
MSGHPEGSGARPLQELTFKCRKEPRRVAPAGLLICPQLLRAARKPQESRERFGCHSLPKGLGSRPEFLPADHPPGQRISLGCLSGSAMHRVWVLARGMSPNWRNAGLVPETTSSAWPWGMWAAIPAPIRRYEKRRVADHLREARLNWIPQRRRLISAGVRLEWPSCSPLEWPWSSAQSAGNPLPAQAQRREGARFPDRAPFY